MWIFVYATKSFEKEIILEFILDALYIYSSFVFTVFTIYLYNTWHYYYWASVWVQTYLCCNHVVLARGAGARGQGHCCVMSWWSFVKISFVGWNLGPRSMNLKKKKKIQYQKIDLFHWFSFSLLPTLNIHVRKLTYFTDSHSVCFLL